jgi:hypothetical protein
VTDRSFQASMGPDDITSTNDHDDIISIFNNIAVKGLIIQPLHQSRFNVLPDINSYKLWLQ